jgi:hypothetical protein
MRLSSARHYKVDLSLITLPGGNNRRRNQSCWRAAMEEGRRPDPLNPPHSTHVSVSTDVKLSRSGAWLGGCFIGLTCLLAASNAQQVAAGRSDPVEWRAGPELQKQLRARVTIQWQEAELRPRLSSLATDQRVAAFLDRRVDPNEKLDFARTNVTLEELFSELAGAVQAASVPVGPVVYIGPPPTAVALAKVVSQRRKELSRYPALARARQQRLRWEELAEPRQLLLDVARQYSLTVVNPEAVPHDLWPAADLPPLSLAEQLTLLLAGFDLTFEVSGDGRELRLVPLPIDVEQQPIVRRPGSVGPTEKDSSHANSRFSLTVMNKPAGAVVNEVAKQIGRQLKYSPAVREKLSSTVNLKVSDVSLDELMEKALTPLGLTYRLTKETLEVVEKH